MSVVNLPLPPDASPGPLPDAVERVAHEEVRVLLTRDGAPVAAIVSIEDLRALERLDGIEDAHWEREADAAVARWEAEGKPDGVTHEELLARHGIIAEDP
jgi:prevent-host-death family protein